MGTPSSLGIIAGNGIYPFLVARAARQKGIDAIHVAAFEHETDPKLVELADTLEWMRVGQLTRLLKYFEKFGVRSAIMAGQIAPKNLFELRPDLKSLMLLANLKERNAATLFGAVASELESVGVRLLPATTFLEDSLAQPGLIAGPKPRKRLLDDARFGLRIAKEVSRLDIGQTVIVRNGTVLAVEAFEGTNDAIRRGASLGKGQAVAVKVSKPDQDLRFDVPVIGCQTVEIASEAGLKLIALEAGKTLLLDLAAVKTAAESSQLTLYGLKE